MIGKLEDIKRIVEDKSLGHKWRYITTHANGIQEIRLYLCDKCKTEGYVVDKISVPAPLPIKRTKIKCEDIKFFEVLA